MGSNFKLSPLHTKVIKEAHLPHEPTLLEIESHLLGARQVVKDHETLALLTLLQLSKINGLSTEGRHASVVGKMGAAKGQVLVELFLNGRVLFLMVALASNSQEVAFSRGTFNVLNLDGEVQAVCLRLKGSEKHVDVLGLVGLESTFGVLDFADSEVMVFPVKLLKGCGIDLVLKLSDSKIFNLNRSGDGPFKANRHGREHISVLQHLKLGAAV
jgi:hypothetical protein